jgi:hypothetical protein
MSGPCALTQRIRVCARMYSSDTSRQEKRRRLEGMLHDYTQRVLATDRLSQQQQQTTTTLPSALQLPRPHQSTAAAAAAFGVTVGSAGQHRGGAVGVGVGVAAAIPPQAPPHFGAALGGPRQI